MQNKKAITKLSKMIIVLQLVIVVGSLSFVYFFAPKLYYPRNNELIEGNEVIFRFKNANVILIDDNPDFNSPQKIDISRMDDIAVRFKPGIYYWKAVNVLESPAKMFTVNSDVGLELYEENSSLENVGNVPLNVTKENEKGISGLAILDVGVKYEVDTENKSIYKGEQYGN